MTNEYNDFHKIIRICVSGLSKVNPNCPTRVVFLFYFNTYQYFNNRVYYAFYFKPRSKLSSRIHILH